MTTRPRGCCKVEQSRSGCGNRLGLTRLKPNYKMPVTETQNPITSVPVLGKERNMGPDIGSGRAERTEVSGVVAAA